MKKKQVSLIVALMIAVMALAGCGTKKSDEAQTPEQPPVETQTEITEFQYITAPELEVIVSEENNEYVLFDVRKKADYDTEHVKGSISADVDSVVSNEDSDPARANIEQALSSTDVAGKKLVLLCYSGKRYAEAATNLLVESGVEAGQIYTLEGGYKGWTNKDLLVK